MDYIRHVIIPRIAVGFIVCYWIIGLAKYSNPDFTIGDIGVIMELFTSPFVLVLVAFLFIMVLVRVLIKKACCKK